MAYLIRKINRLLSHSSKLLHDLRVAPDGPLLSKLIKLEARAPISEQELGHEVKQLVVTPKEELEWKGLKI